MTVATTLRSAAAQVGRLAAEHAAGADTDRRLPAQVVRALLDAGFARHFVPSEWGGAQGVFGELTEAVATVGEGCASSAWMASLCAYSGRLGAYLPPAGQADLWARGPDAVVVGGVVPSGRLRPEPGGWRISGRWSYVSGVDMSEWALVCAPARAEPDQVRFMAVPRKAYTVEDTWSSIGMRATASNTLTLDDVFVPDHRSFARRDVDTGQPAASLARCHRVPLRAVSGLAFAAPVLGAARGALRSFVTRAAARGPGGAESVGIGLARSAGEVDAAQLLLDRVARVGDTGPVTAAEVVRNARDTALAVDLCVSAVNRIFRLGGTGGQLTDHPIQRAWRDVNCAASHVALRFDRAAAAYANQILAAD